MQVQLILAVVTRDMHSETPQSRVLSPLLPLAINSLPRKLRAQATTIAAYADRISNTVSGKLWTIFTFLEYSAEFKVSTDKTDMVVSQGLVKPMLGETNSQSLLNTQYSDILLNCKLL